MIRIQTSASSKVIRQTLQALYKAKAITAAHKFQYAKHYLPDASGRLKTENVQIVLLHTDMNWDKSGESILKNVLKSYLTLSNLLLT